MWYKHAVPRLVVHTPGGVASSLQVQGELRIGRDAELEVVLCDSKVSAPPPLRHGAANRARSAFLSNLPTLVLGTASITSIRSGSCQLANP
jgi:hypothetical protein